MIGNRKYLSIPAYRIASALAHSAAVALESRDALVLPVPINKICSENSHLFSYIFSLVSRVILYS